MLRNGHDTPQCWTSLTHYRRTKDGHYCNSISLLGFEARSLMSTGLSPSRSCPRSRLLASPRGLTLKKFARRPLSALSRHMTFYSEVTTLQNLAPLLLERTSQASWEVHLLSSTACGLPNKDITRQIHSQQSTPFL